MPLRPMAVPLRVPSTWMVRPASMSHGRTPEPFAEMGVEMVTCPGAMTRLMSASLRCAAAIATADDCVSTVSDVERSMPFATQVCEHDLEPRVLQFRGQARPAPENGEPRRERNLQPHQ
jgi:hypothetical protein